MGSGRTPASTAAGSESDPVLTTPAGPGADAFNRARVAEGVQLFSGVRDFARGGGVQLDALRYDTAVVGGGTTATNTHQASTTLSVTDTQNDSAVLQTKEYFIYRAGQSQLALMTFTLGANVVGIRKRVGLFDASDGIFIEQATDGTINIVTRSSASGGAVETSVAQSAWNVDVFDGTGQSGITLDVTTTQIFVVDLQYLGVGRVRCGFDVNGDINYVHEFNHANVAGNTVVYMRSASLPLRWEITATAALPADSDALTAICGTVAREGSVTEPGVQTFVKSTAAVTAVGGRWEMLTAVRLRSANIRASLRQFQAAVFNANATNPVEWQFVVNPTLASATVPTYANIHTTTSVGEWSETATVSIVDGSGHRLLHGYSGAANRGGSGVVTGTNEDLPLVADIAGTADVGILAVRAITGTAACWASLGFRELY